MGMPLRFNIFTSGSTPPDYFARFPVQVAVLFSPQDAEFAAAFKHIFLRLDQMTGQKVVFVAVLDPPEDWKTVAANREFWSRHVQEAGRAGVSYDDGVVVREIARLFRVPWHALPALVVSTNLWNTEYVVASTSASQIEEQLRRLTHLVSHWGKPNTGHVADTLSTLAGYEVDYFPPSEQLRERLDSTYRMLNTDIHKSSQDNFHRQAARELYAVQKALSHSRWSPDKSSRNQSLRENDIDDRSDATDSVLEDASGRLVAPATVAARFADTLFSGSKHLQSSINHLEDESRVMIQTALRVGNFLEMDEDGQFSLSPLNRGRVGRNNEGTRTDFAPGVQGALKAFELEIYLSIIQAARKSRTIDMPGFFARYRPNLRRSLAEVNTGNNYIKDINQQDRSSRSSDRHKFLPLGDAWHVAKTMYNSREETLVSVLQDCLNKPLPTDFFAAWEFLFHTRNDASHTRPLTRRDYESVLQKSLSSNTLEMLVAIKTCLSGSHL